MNCIKCVRVTCLMNYIDLIVSCLKESCEVVVVDEHP